MIMWTLFSVWALVGLTILAGSIRVGFRTHAFRGLKQVAIGVIALPACAALWPLLAITTLVLNTPRLIAMLRG